jgi:hypothetical protein
MQRENGGGWSQSTRVELIKYIILSDSLLLLLWLLIVVVVVVVAMKSKTHNFDRFWQQSKPECN